MMTIGSFKANGDEFTGEIATLTIQAKAVRIVRVKRTNDAGPSHRVYASRVESGRARPGPSAPREDHSLIWSRGTRRDRD